MTEGMVAVVKGLRDCGLAVALMGDDGKTYTLVPNAGVGTGPGAKPPRCFDAGAQVNDAPYYTVYGGGARSYAEMLNQGVGTVPSPRQHSCDSSAQATDGRYASVYQTQHCNVAPTSPPALYAEFPPQRTEMCRGHGSFHVGGTGSGEASFIPTKSTSYRGAMNWADRGSVCSPRLSRGTDAFANSLRKYPVSSPERSQELMERLVNYSQGRNYPQSPQRNHSPPNRSYGNITPPSYPESSVRGSRQGLYEPDRRQRAPEDCPTTDRRWPETEPYKKTTFSKTNDARFVRDVSKRLKDSIKSMSNYPNLPPASDICNSLDAPEMCVSENCSVDTETQVASDMFSPTVAVATVAAPTQTIHSVAVPLSAIPSCLLSEQTVIVEATHACRSAQPLLPVSSQKSVQTSTSSVVPSASDGKLSKKNESSSGYRIDEGLKDEILKWLEDNTDPKLKKLQDTVMKKLSKRYKKMSVSNSEKYNVKSEDKEYHENDGNKIIDGIIDKLIRMHLRYCEAVDSAEMIKATRSDQSFEQTSKVLINEISLKKHNFSRTLKKEQVYDAFVDKIKQWSFKKPKAYRKQSLRAEILYLLHDAPIDFHGLSKMVYLNTLAEAFVTKLNNAPVEHKNTTNRCDEYPEPSRRLCVVQKKPCHPTIKQLKILIADSIIEFINKIKVKLKLEIVEEITKDLIKILSDATIRLNISDENFATEIATLVENVTMFPENEATKFATPCTGQKKYIFNGNDGPETFFVLQDTSFNHSSAIVSNNSNSRRADKEESSELNIYKRHLSEQIDEWVCSLDIPVTRNQEFRKHLVNDLAGDIVDRYKYLELNKDCVYKTDELEHLKYQIFKWINKLVGDGNNEAVNHAAELMERIRVIQKPGTTSSHEQNIKLNKDTTNAGSSQKTGKTIDSADYDDGSLNLVYSENVINSDTNTYLGHRKDPYQNVQMPTDKNIQTDWFTCGERYIEKFADGYLSELNSIYGTSHWRDFQRIPIHPHTINTSTQTIFPSLIDRGFQTNEEQVPPASIARIPDSRSDCCKPLTSSLKPLSPGPNSPATPSIKQLNDEFEEYLNNWVNDIPIQTNNPEELAVAEKARIGIRHGIWKAIASAKSQPAVFFNRFYYEDIMSDAIDELLDILPQTQELQDKRYMLKVKLIEKMMDITDLIKIVSTPASYKQELAELVAANLQRRTVKTQDEDPNQLYEEMHIQCIVEDFILASCYKNEDKLKETAYRNKLKKKVELLINEAKKTHGKNFRDLNKEICVQDIINALSKVPPPSDVTLKDEADEIILGHEIDQWFADLPIVKNDDLQEKYLRRRLKDALTIKLHELEKNINFADCYEEPEFKHEISLFLEKVPLEKDESLNINFMVGELANRIRNRDRPGHRRKAVAFEVEEPECCRINRRQENGRSQDDDQCRDNCRDQYSGRGQDDGRGQNNVHTNAPKASMFTRQPFDEDDYNMFHKEKPANSTMINPPPEPQRYNNKQLPDYRKWGIDSQPSDKWYSFDSAGNIKPSQEPPQEEFAYVPGQFQEQHLGGKFGDFTQIPSADMQQSSPRYARYNARDSADATRHRPPIRQYFDNSGKYIPSPVDQNQPNPAPQNVNRIPLFNNQSAMQAPEDDYANVDAPVPADDRAMDMSSFRQFTSDKPASSSWQEQPEDEYHSLLYDGPPQPLQSQHRTHYEPYELPPEEVQGGFALDGKRLSERPGQQTSNPFTYNPEPRPGMDQHQPNPEDFNLPNSVQPPSSPRSHTINGRNLEMANGSRQASSQISPDRAGMKKANEQNRSPAIGRTYIKITEPIENSQPPTSSQRPDEQDQRLLAQTPPQTGLSIDNQPVGSSTPNQRPTNDYPPNIKERRQVERERYSRPDYGTDDDQHGRHKCLCLERPMRRMRLPGDTNFQNLEDQGRSGERNRPSERDYGTDDDLQGARERFQYLDGARRCTRRWCDYEDYIRRIPLVCPYPYLSHPCFNLRKKSSRCFSSRYPGCNKRVPKFPR